MPERAASFAGEVDALFFFILGISGLFTIGIWVTLLYFGIRYRRRSDDDRPKEIYGSLALELAWTIIPAAIMAVMFVWGAKVFFEKSNSSPVAAKRKSSARLSVQPRACSIPSTYRRPCPSASCRRATGPS